MQIFIDKTRIEPLLEAIDRAPLSAGLRLALMDELISPGFFGTGSDGFIAWKDMAATKTGDERVSLSLGRVGKSMVAALRALADCAVDKEGDRG